MNVMKRIINSKSVLYILPLLSLALLITFINVTNPGSVGPLGIFIVFTLLYVFFLGFVFFCLNIAQFAFKKVKKRKLAVSTHKQYYISSVVAFFPVLLLGIHSVGQLEIRDIILVLVFIALAVFYFIKRT